MPMIFKIVDLLYEFHFGNIEQLSLSGGSEKESELGPSITQCGPHGTSWNHDEGFDGFWDGGFKKALQLLNLITERFLHIFAGTTIFFDVILDITCFFSPETRSMISYGIVQPEQIESTVTLAQKSWPTLQVEAVH